MLKVKRKRECDDDDQRGFVDSRISMSPGSGIKENFRLQGYGRQNCRHWSRAKGSTFPANADCVCRVSSIEHIMASDGLRCHWDGKDGFLPTRFGRANQPKMALTSFCPTTMDGWDRAHILAALQSGFTKRAQGDERDALAHPWPPIRRAVYFGRRLRARKRAEDIRPCDVSLMKEFHPSLPRSQRGGPSPY